jgi:hypothetical protein
VILRFITLIALLWAVPLTASPGTPGPPPADALPVLSFTTDADTGLLDGPARTSVGWVSVRLDNRTEADAQLQFVRLPPGKTESVYFRDIEGTVELPYPDWYDDIVFVPGPAVIGGNVTSETVVRFTAGRWGMVWATRSDVTWQDLAVVPGGSQSSPAFEPAFAMRFDGSRVDVGASVAAGRHLWEIRVGDSSLHAPCVLALPPGVTRDRLVQFLVNGIPAPGVSGIPFEIIAQASKASAGQVAGVWFDLAPGNYAMGDCEWGRLTEGAVATFTVHG